MKMHHCEIVGNLDHNWWSNLDKKSASAIHVTTTSTHCKQQTPAQYTVPTQTSILVGGATQRYANFASVFLKIMFLLFASFYAHLDMGDLSLQYSIIS